MAACCAAKGVPLRDPRKPSDPELFQESTLPCMSEMVTMVLLNDAWICATPCGTCLRSLRLNCFFLPFFSGAAGAPAAGVVGFAIILCLRRRFLFLCHCALAWALAGARVGMRPLPAHGKVATMAEAAIGADFDQTLDVHGGVFAQVAFDPALGLDNVPNAVDLVLVQVLHLLRPIHLGLLHDALRARVADAVNVGQRNRRVLVAR